MNEFDLRKFLYNNPLMEKKEDSKKGNKEMQKRMKGAIEDDADHIEDLKKDIKANKKKLAKLKKDEPMDVNEMKKQGYDDREDESLGARRGAEKDKKQSMKDRRDDSYGKFGKRDAEKKGKNKINKEGMDYYEDGDMNEEMEDKKLTKEGLKNMIREKITSILNEQEDVDVEDDVNVDVEDEENVDVDIEKDVEVDDKSEEAEIEVDAEVAGQSADASGLEGLLKKAREMAKDQGDDKLVRQISNTIIQHERSIAAGEEEM